MPDNMDDKKKELLATRFLDNLANEAKLKGKELALKEKGIQGSLQLAEKSIEAQRADNKEERDYNFKIRLMMLIFLGALFILFMCFLGYALHIDKADIVYKILDYLPTMGMSAATGVSGFFYGKSKSNAPSKNQDNEE